MFICTNEADILPRMLAAGFLQTHSWLTSNSS
jgi:hypothetical protein